MIPLKQKVISDLQDQLKVKLHQMKDKRIFYTGVLDDGKEIVVCTPESKIYPKGHGWVDITTKQYEILEHAFEGLILIRLGNNKIYNINFKELQSYLIVDAMIYNPREGDHWKLHILPNHIKVLGNENLLPIQPITFEETINQ